MKEQDVTTGTEGWRPLLEGAPRDEALRVVRQLAEALAAQARNDSLPPALYGGTAGLALLFAWLHRVMPSEQHESLCEHFLENATTAMTARPMGASLSSGFTGVSWVLQHLQGQDDGGADEDDLSEVDAALARRLNRSPWVGDFDLIGGLVGLGVYALERWPRPEAVRCLEGVVARLGELAEEQPAGLAWRSRPELLPEHQRQRFPQGKLDLGVAHGVPGLLPVLAGAVRVGVAEDEAWRLLRGAWRFVMAQRLPHPGMRLPAQRAQGETPAPARAAWCYGDPGVALAMLHAARAVGDTTWEAEALALAREAAQRPQEGSGVVDAGLCHGSAGLAHVYNRLHQATREEVFSKAARQWLEHLLAARQPERGLGGFPSWSMTPEGFAWVDKAGLLEGAAGVALALLAACSSAEPTWDRVLLMSLRVTPRAGEVHRVTSSGSGP